jgi:hypothetical protein
MVANRQLGLAGGAVMKNSIVVALVAIAVVAAVPAHATTSGFDFTQCTTNSNYYGNAQTEAGTCGSAGYSNTSNQFSQSVTGIGTVTATAYTTGTGTHDSGAAGTALTSATSAYVGQYTGYGLGVCSVGDSGFSSDGCTPPDHQVDNGGSYEFILFTFSTPVDLNTITLANFGGGSLSDMDISYWVNPSSEATIPAGATNVLCGAGGGAGTCPSVEGSGDGIGAGSMTDTVDLTDVTTLLIGAYTASSDKGDTYFKIQGLGGVTDYHTGVSPTPQPATFGLIGLSLAGLGVLRRKRKIK